MKDEMVFLPSAAVHTAEVSISKTDLLDFISRKFYPEEIYEEYVLREWAEAYGYYKKEEDAWNR